MDCGGKSTDNTTYLQLTTKTSFKASEAACSYTICKTNPKVCRIRFDFTVRIYFRVIISFIIPTISNETCILFVFQTFQIANPSLGKVVAAVVDSTLEDHSGICLNRQDQKR